MKNLIMTPGPTYVHEDVRKAMAKPITNPDIDLSFYEFYKETTSQLQKLLKTQNDVLILSGEGILGLEAACASLIEAGDRVLCIDNGIFGNGFGDFAKIYGAEVVYYKSDYEKGLNAQKLKEFLNNDHNFKLATFVHCETPSGITNNIKDISLLLKDHNILTVVDSVAAIGGEELQTDKWGIDVILGGSQKCLSAPPGLTFLAVSNESWHVMQNRKQDITSFYANLLIWKDWYEKKWFPYTQPISEIYALREACERLLADNYLERHYLIADAVRKSLQKCGLQLYAKNSFSNTVTAVMLPQEISFTELYNDMLNNYKIMIGGAFGYLKDKIFRIGHMGENCYEEKLYLTLKALNNSLKKHNVVLNGQLHLEFVKNINS